MRLVPTWIAICQTAPVCMQCMVGAMGASAGATGARSYLAARRWGWLTAARLRRLTQLLLGSALLAASFLLG